MNRQQRRAAAAVARSAKQPVRLSAVQRGGDMLRARYDAAQTTTDNRKHWQWADDLSARAAQVPEVRRVLRRRSRYEVANNSYAKGILSTLANYVVGTGPRLQLRTADDAFNLAVERRFGEWCIRTQFVRKLWLMRHAQAMDGESFGVFFSNMAMRSPVKLDIKVVEADQVADPVWLGGIISATDGIMLDDYGNPAAYKVLRQHPGDLFTSGFPLEYDVVPADSVAHLYKVERASQVRGIPEITAALPLFAQLRRFTLATLAAAETAAEFAGIIKTQAPPEEPTDVDPFDVVEIEKRYLMTLPAGYDITQMKAEHPTTTYEMFVRNIIQEMARCLNMPYNIAAMNSAGSNFSSGKLDYQSFFKSIEIDQDHIEDAVASPAFERWYAEAVRVPGFLPPPPVDGTPDFSFFWDGQDLMDPREAGAKDIALRNGSETFGRIYAKRGLDANREWEANAKLLGLTIEAYKAMILDNLRKTPQLIVEKNDAQDE